MLSGVPDEWGPKFQLDGGAVTRTHTGPNSIHFTASTHMALVLLTAQPQRQVSLNSDRKMEGLAPAGALEIVPVQSELFARWVVEKQNLLIAVDPGHLEQLAGMEFDRDSFELRPPKLGVVDAQAHMLARWMRREMEAKELGCEESLDAQVTLFSIHLLRNYSSLKGRSTSIFNGGLSSNAWRRVNDFIQAHLTESLSLKRLATVARSLAQPFRPGLQAHHRPVAAPIRDRSAAGLCAASDRRDRGAAERGGEDHRLFQQ